MSNRYKTILKALSERTGTPLPSLLLSFGVLHEITALVPLVGFFYGARTLGIGEVVIDTILQSNPSLPGDHQVDWYRGTLRKWVEEGDKWACRVGQRYGVFGFEKRSSSSDSARDVAERIPASSRIAGDIANAVVAYGLTKAIIPIRIGVSLYLSPACSRRIVEPLRQKMLQTYRRMKL